VSRGPGRPHAEDDGHQAPLIEPLKHALQETDFEVPEAFREAPSFSNIPELRSPWAEWKSKKMKIVFVLLLITSIFQTLAAINALSLALPSYIAGLLGIVSGCMYICDPCQGIVIDTSVRMVRFKISRAVFVGETIQRCGQADTDTLIA
jgi:hypothetical protein